MPHHDELENIGDGVGGPRSHLTVYVDSSTPCPGPIRAMSALRKTRRQCQDKIHKSRYTWYIANLSREEDSDVAVQNRFCTHPLRRTPPVRVVFSGVENLGLVPCAIALQYAWKGS